MKPTGAHAVPVWIEHIGSALIVATVFAVLWRPAAMESSAEKAEKDGRVAELAALLGERVARPGEVERILPAATRFPPSQQAVRDLASALGGCDMSGLSDEKRVQLARHVYAITMGEDLSRRRLAMMLGEIQDNAIAARCSPITVGALVDSARRVARTDPQPRSDWW